MTFEDLSNSIEWCLRDYVDTIQITYDFKLLAIKFFIGKCRNGVFYSQEYVISNFVNSKNFYAFIKYLQKELKENKK